MYPNQLSLNMAQYIDNIRLSNFVYSSLMTEQTNLQIIYNQFSYKFLINLIEMVLLLVLKGRGKNNV